MYCTRCGKKNDDRAVFCVGCGERFGQSTNKKMAPATGFSGSSNTVKRYVAGKSPKKTPNSVKIVIAATGVLSILAFFLIIGAVSNRMGLNGQVSTKWIAEDVTKSCYETGYTVDDVSVQFRKRYDLENGEKLEIYDVTVKVLGKGTGKLLIGYIVGQNTCSIWDVYPHPTLFDVGLDPDFSIHGFTEADIDYFAENGGDYFFPGEY